MEDNNFANEIFCNDKVFYVENKFFCKNLIRFMIMNLAIMILFTKKNIMGFMILELISLVFSMVALMFVIHSGYFSKKKLYKVLEIHLGLICFIYIIRLFPSTYLGGMNYPPNSMQVIWDNNFNFILLYYLISKYRKESSNSVYFEYAFWIIAKIAYNIINNNLLGNLFIDTTYLALELMLLVAAMFNMKKEKIINNNKVNVFMINLLLSLTVTIVAIFLKDAYIVDLSVAKFIIYEACMLSLMFNLVESTYNFIFRNTYEENRKLELVNNRIKVRNIEMERSQELMIERERMYRNFLEVIPKPIVEISMHNERILYCNKSFLHLINEKNIRNIINKKVDSIIDHNIYFNDILHLDENKGYLGSTKGKEVKNLEIRLLKVSEENERIMISLEDITENIEMERMKKEVEENKLKDILKKNFLSHISHDLKTPINVIYSATQIADILVNNNDVNNLKKYNEISSKNCVTLIQLTNNLIDISKINIECLHPKLEVRNIVEDIEEKVISLAEYIKGKKINLIFDTSEEEIYVNSDREFMERIILNLISNSVKFTRPDGYIFIDIKADYEKVYIEVRDTGKGMSKEFVNQAFDKYSMENINTRMEDGSGVGLFVVYNLVKKQNGSIKIESEIGKGSIFTIEFSRVKVNGF